METEVKAHYFDIGKTLQLTVGLDALSMRAKIALYGDLHKELFADIPTGDEFREAYSAMLDRHWK